MDGKAIVQSVIQEIIQPGIQRLMESRYFSELRDGKLSIKRLQGWAIQHYLHNKAILKSFALGMIKNAHDQELFNYYTYQCNEEQTHPDLAKNFGPALVLNEQAFAEAAQIFECQIHPGRTIDNPPACAGPLCRASALTSESMVWRYSEECNPSLRKNYGLSDDALEFFTVHMVADKEHTAQSAERIALVVKTPRDERVVRENAQYMVRIKLDKFEG